VYLDAVAVVAELDTLQAGLVKVAAAAMPDIPATMFDATTVSATATALPIRGVLTVLSCSIFCRRIIRYQGRAAKDLLGLGTPLSWRRLEGGTVGDCRPRRRIEPGAGVRR